MKLNYTDQNTEKPKIKRSDYIDLINEMIYEFMKGKWIAVRNYSRIKCTYEPGYFISKTKCQAYCNSVNGDTSKKEDYDIYKPMPIFCMFSAPNFKYHLSWDSIIPVAKKILKLTQGNKKERRFASGIKNALLKTDISLLWEACKEYVWYKFKERLNKAIYGIK